jgi:signal transduction histidine kinase
MSAAAPSKLNRGLDWRTIFMGLPKRVFSAEELSRALPERPSLSLWLAAAVNVAIPWVATVAYMLWREQWFLAFATAGSGLGLGVAATRAWRNPSDRVSHWVYYLLPAGVGVAFGILSQERAWVQALDKASLGLFMLCLLGGAYALWFLIAYRHQHVSLRLRELDEQARTLAMAQQLTQAQIQPHFLFNSLAALQHWVHSKDDRAAPMLDALTAFLRATLPLFDRERIRLGDEEAAVRQYLEVMQHRLGERLRFHIDIDPAAREWMLPPGLLLTLVENAVEHGVQPQLAGGGIEVRAAAQGPQAVIEVSDDGPGMVDHDTHKPNAGVGLSNSRARLARTFGPAAALQLHNRLDDAGNADGCVARITFPLTP